MASVSLCKSLLKLSLLSENLCMSPYLRSVMGITTVAADKIDGPVTQKPADYVHINPQVLENDLSNTRPYSEVPQQKGPPMLRTIVNKLFFNQHDLMKRNFQKFGPLYKEIMFGKYQFVYTCDKDSLERLHRLEGKYPLRLIMDPWKKWREQNDHALGILISEGAEWKRMRTSLDKQMLRPKQVENYAEDMNEVVTEFIERLRRVRHEDMSVEKMDEELFNWSLETIGTVIYEKRFDAFSSHQDPELKQFIVAVNAMFESTSKVTYMPEFIQKTVGKKWIKMHSDAWNVIFTTGKKFIDEKMEQIQKNINNNEEVSGFLSSLLASQKISMEEIYANISELMAAAVDTTSNTMQWCLYELSRNPDYQELLLEEQKSVLGDRTVTTYSDLQKMPLLKAVLKEVLRMYPIAGFVTRTLKEDFNLCGYRIPKGTHVLGNTLVLGRHPDHYDDPDTFKPERWLRSDQNNVHSFAWLPFGHGPRMCIGKRVAELELHLLMARLIRQFVIERGDSRDLKINQAALLIPDRPVAVKLIDRK